MRHAGAVLLAAALLLPACGGDDEGAIPEDEYLKRARQVCRTGNRELSEASDKAFADIPEDQKPTDEQVAAFVRETVVPMVRDQVQELRDLPPPKGGADEVDEIYDAVEKDLKRLEDDPALLTKTGLFAEADRLGTKYGYPVCTAGD